MSVKTVLKRALRYIIKGIPENKVNVKVISLAQNELLEGKTALITGGTSGIGLAIAVAFLKAGANVVVTGRSQEKATKIANDIQVHAHEGAFVLGFGMDSASTADLEKNFKRILSLPQLKQIDILVNNAGTMGTTGGLAKNCTEEEYNSIMDLNVKGTFFLSKLLAQYMIEKSIKGNILNIASSSSLRPCSSAYMLSKWGIRGMTAGFAKMLASHGIVVNGIAPGPTATPMLKKFSNNEDFSLPNNPSGRYAHPDEIANMAVILTSDMGRMIVGDIVYMTGGSGNITYDDLSYNF